MSVFREKPDLLARFRAGDRDALEEVYRAYVDKVSEVVANGFRIVGTGGAIVGLGGRPADLADTVQEIFLKAFSRNARMSFDGVRDFGPYLGRIARNVMIDRARRLARELLVPEVDLDSVGSTASGAPYAEIVEQWEDPEALEVAHRFIDELPPELARIHRVRYVEGLSQRDAAVHLGLTRQVIRSLEGKLREGLRELLLQNRARDRISADPRERKGSSSSLR